MLGPSNGKIIGKHEKSLDFTFKKSNDFYPTGHQTTIFPTVLPTMCNSDHTAISLEKWVTLVGNHWNNKEEIIGKTKRKIIDIIVCKIIGMIVCKTVGIIFN